MRVQAHAIRRFRERWPEWAYLGDRAITKRLLEAVKRSRKTESAVYGPHASYHFFSLGGKDGYVVVGADCKQIVTIMPADWCPQVNEARSCA